MAIASLIVNGVTVVGVTEEDNLWARKAAMMAVKAPYAITDMNDFK